MLFAKNDIINLKPLNYSLALMLGYINHSPSAILHSPYHLFHFLVPSFLISRFTEGMQPFVFLEVYLLLNGTSVEVQKRGTREEASMDGIQNCSPVSGENIALEVRSELDEENEVIKWFEKTFSKKECNYFIPAGPGKQQRCGCGLLRSKHRNEIFTASGKEWSPKQHVGESPTDAFGFVSFSEKQQDSSNEAEYVRLADSTIPESVWYLLKNRWSLKPPTLIMSIVGGNTDEHIDLNTKLSIEKGLSKIIQMTDVWMLTGATRTEVTKVVAKAFQENYRRERSMRNACIGIVPWGCIVEREQLQGQLTNVIYSPSSNMAKENRFLEENHTHFLLVDNGTSGRFGTDRIFRSKLERFLSSPVDSKPIPSVNLLIHGGYNACMQIKENLQCHPSIPTVVLKRSGGLADVLDDALVAHNSGKHGVRLLNHITLAMSNAFTETDPEKLAKLRGAIKQIVEERNDQIVIFDPKGDPYGLHHAIVEACKSSSYESVDRFNRLQLAIHLGEIEMAAVDIQRAGEDAGDLKETLYKSIKKGKDKFVEFLLNFGVNLKDFLAEDKNKLRKLYRSKLRHENFLKLMLKDNELTEFQKTDKFDLHVLDRLLHDLMEGDYTSCYGPPSSKFKLENNAFVEMSPAQELIIWALFSNMPGMVECFWKFETERALENALIISRIYTALTKEFVVDEVEREDFELLAKKYENHAVDLLGYCYRQNSKTSVDIVKSRIPLWGFKNLVTLAANGLVRDFVAHTCCQTYLKQVWLGRSERKTVSSELLQLQAQVRYPRKRLYSTLAKIRQKKYQKEKRKDEPDGQELPRHKRIRKKLANMFWFLFFVPKGKLFLHEFIFTLFLGCFTFLVLVKKGEHHDTLRYIVFTIVTALTMDEIREIAEIRKSNIFLKLREWSRSSWNKLDIVAMILFYVGFAFEYYDLKSAERTILAVDLVLWVIKFAQFYRMFYSLGPYLIMIYKMMFHMIGFVLVLLIAVVAYGIFMHTLLFPDVSVSWQILFKLLFRPYLLVFGELGIDRYSLSSNSTVYGTEKVSESTEIIVVVGMCVYLLLANVLLLNMLIAVFNNIYEDIKENSDKIWKYDKYGMIMEFKNKPSIPIPLSVFSNIPRILFRLCRDETYRAYVQETKDQLTDMKDFQKRCTKAFHQECDRTSTVEENVAVLMERTEHISKALADLDERSELSFSKLTFITKKLTAK